MSKRSRRGPHNRELATAGPARVPAIMKTKTATANSRPAPKPTPILSPKEAAEQEMARMAAGRKQAMAGFAISFSLMGLLAGLNHWIETPTTVTGGYALSVWLGAALGDLRLDWVRAMLTGGMGLIVGVTLGSTFGLRSPKMFAAWVMGGLALAIGLVSTHNPAVGALGWLLGVTLAVRSPVA